MLIIEIALVALELWFAFWLLMLVIALVATPFALVAHGTMFIVRRLVARCSRQSAAFG